MGDAEVVNEVGDALVGVEEFDEGRAGAGGGSLEADAGEDAEKGAVHELAVGEVEDDAGGAAFLEAGDEFLEVHAGGEVGAAGNFDDGGVVLEADGELGGGHGVHPMVYLSELRGAESSGCGGWDRGFGADDLDEGLLE